MKTFTNTFEETKLLGLAIAKECKGGEIFALTGELGAGKTVFTKGLGSGLGIKNNIVSPTFMLVRTYKGNVFNLIHFDFYRLDNDYDLYSIGFDDYLEEKNIIVIEWAEKFFKLIPDNIIKISINVINESKREIDFQYDKSFDYLFKSVSQRS